jgi:exosortase A-associated hydrolase 2
VPAAVQTGQPQEHSLCVEFVSGNQGSLLVTSWRPVGEPTACALFVAPFGDEMNKSRAAIAELGRVLAAIGCAVIVADVSGTGESAGEFRDAHWENWLADLAVVVEWAAATLHPVTTIIGLRLGCLLGAELASRLTLPIRHTVLIQPVTSGQRFLTQFLRLRVAGTVLNGAGRTTVGDLRGKLAEGQLLEVGGYELNGELANEIDARSLYSMLGSHSGRLHWIEVRPVSIGVQQSVAVGPTAAASNLHFTCYEARGVPFWLTSELARSPEMVTIVVSILAGQ